MENFSKLIIIVIVIAVILSIGYYLTNMFPLDKQMNNAESNFSLQTKCADMASKFFAKFNNPDQGLDILGWGSASDNFVYDYINHYNPEFNTCFILIKGDDPLNGYSNYGLYNIVENKWDASKTTRQKGDTCFIFDIRKADGSANNSCKDYDQFVHERMEGSEIN